MLRSGQPAQGGRFASEPEAAVLCTHICIASQRPAVYGALMLRFVIPLIVIVLSLLPAVAPAQPGK
jgi:hypothetical protein